MNLNYNFIDSQLNRPGPLLITNVYYLLVGGGAGGDNQDGGGSNIPGQGGGVLEGFIPVKHLTSFDFTIGHGGRGDQGDGINGPIDGTDSTIVYSTDSLNLIASGGLATTGPSCPTNFPCDGVNVTTWPDTTYDDYWGMDGGTWATTLTPWGGGKKLPPDISIDWPYADQGNIPAQTYHAYNHTGGGGASNQFNGGNGAQGMAAFAVYDPRNRFDIVLTTPSRKGGNFTTDPYPVRDSDDAFTQRLVNGWKIWYVTYTDGTGNFVINGKND
jgi:hypothetical protein